MAEGKIIVEGKELAKGVKVSVSGDFAKPASGTFSLSRSPLKRDDTYPLWMWIRTASERTSFSEYAKFIDRVLCDKDTKDPDCCPERRLRESLSKEPCIHGMDAYDLLKTATETFLLIRCGCTCGPFQKGMHPDEFLDPEKKKPDPCYRKPDDPESTTREGASAQKQQEAGEKSNCDPCACAETEGWGEKDDPGSEVKRLEDDFPLPGGTLKDISDKLASYLRTKDINYLNTILTAAFGENWREQTATSAFCDGKILCAKSSCPCLLELIWSYWHEEGMLAQTLNAISLRFQNKRRGAGRDPLAELEIDPLRPLNNFLWGYIQDEVHRLTVPRRAYEYSHHYGLALAGKAVSTMRPADNRSKFLEAFHDLLYRSSVFFQEDSDTTVISDGFPLLNALKEVHLLLAQGAHNQFGDLPWTARVEMMMQQWLLSRPEMREFLGTRIMVPYAEPWMGRVDAMKRVQGWSDVTVTHFRDLGVLGERILLSIRYGNWNVLTDQEHARTWARYWKPEIQGYLHAYRAATGVDLTAQPVSGMVNATMPSVLLSQRLQSQLTGGRGR